MTNNTRRLNYITLLPEISSFVFQCIKVNCIPNHIFMTNSFRDIRIFTRYFFKNFLFSLLNVIKQIGDCGAHFALSL